MRENDLTILKKHLKRSIISIDLGTDLDKLQRYVGYNVAIESIINFIDSLRDGQISEEYLKTMEEDK